MIKFVLILFSLVSSQSFSLTTHQELSSFKTLNVILQQITSAGIKSDEILMVFDIDNTLLAMNQDLGSDQWFSLESEKIKQGKGGNFQTLLHWQEILFFLSKMHLTEKSIPFQLERWQETKIKTIALTSRGPKYRYQTERELSRQQISFVNNMLGKNIFGKFYPSVKARPVSYQNGIFMTSG